MRAWPLSGGNGQTRTRTRAHRTDRTGCYEPIADRVSVAIDNRDTRPNTSGHYRERRVSGARRQIPTYSNGHQ